MLPYPGLEKVISGAQTGADRAGLLAAEQLGIATGGFMPTGSGRKPRLNPAAAAPPSGGPRSGRPPATPTMQRERDGRDGRAAGDFDFSAQGQLTIRR